MPLAATIGIIFYTEPFEIAVFIGGFVIIGANFINIRAEQKAAKRA